MKHRQHLLALFAGAFVLWTIRAGINLFQGPPVGADPTWIRGQLFDLFLYGLGAAGFGYDAWKTHLRARNEAAAPVFYPGTEAVLYFLTAAAILAWAYFLGAAIATLAEIRGWGEQWADVGLVALAVYAGLWTLASSVRSFRDWLRVRSQPRG